MSKVVHILHDDYAQHEPSEHGGLSVRPERRTSHHFPILAATAVALFLAIFGVMMWRGAYVPDDRHVHAQLQRVKREIAQRRAVRDRTATVAGLADRIVQAPAGRRAQREWLDEERDTE